MKKTSQIAGTAFTGCMFTGIGLGMYLGNVGAGTMVGMGIGFAFMALIHLSARQRNEMTQNNEK